MRVHDYIDISDDDTLPVGIQEVVAFGVSSEDFGDSPLHLRETGEDVLCVQGRNKKTERSFLLHTDVDVKHRYKQRLNEKCRHNRVEWGGCIM